MMNASTAAQTPWPPAGSAPSSPPRPSSTPSPPPASPHPLLPTAEQLSPGPPPGADIDDEIRTAAVLVLNLKSLKWDFSAWDAKNAAAAAAAAHTKRTTAPHAHPNLQQQQNQQPQQLHMYRGESDDSDDDSAGRKRGTAQAAKPPAKRKKDQSVDARGQVPIGAECACRTRDPLTSEVDWILGKVVAYSHETKRYTVEDAADDERDKPQREKKLYKVTRGQIRVLPKTSSAAKLDLPKGTRVIALYPDTTVFYPATVEQSALEGPGGVKYSLEFDDEEPEEPDEICTWVLARYVLTAS